VPPHPYAVACFFTEEPLVRYSDALERARAILKVYVLHGTCGLSFCGGNDPVTVYVPDAPLAWETE
jgi:hypothetical protein